MRRLVVAILAVLLCAGVAFAAPIGGTKVDINQHQNQGLVQGQFSTGGINVQQYSTNAGQGYHLNNSTGGFFDPGVTAGGGTSAETSGFQANCGGLQVQGAVYGSKNGASSIVSGGLIP